MSADKDAPVLKISFYYKYKSNRWLFIFLFHFIIFICLRTSMVFHYSCKKIWVFFYQSTLSGFHILAKAAMKYVSWHAISTGRPSMRSYSTQNNFQMFNRQNVFYKQTRPGLQKNYDRPEIISLTETD